MREYVKLSVVLLLICAIACGALGFVNEITKDVIAENNAKVAAQARMDVMQAADDITEKVEADQVENIAAALGVTTEELAEIYVAKKGGEVVGYTFTTNSKGFGGTLNVITGIDIDGKITGAKVVSHAETPGLGAKSTDPNWIGQYAGLTADGTVSVVKSGTPSGNQILAITGSTITSNGVTSGINTAGKAFQALVSGSSNLTPEEIAENNRKAAMPEADDIKEAMAADKVAGIDAALGVTEVYVAKKGGEVIGYTFTTAAEGYGGPVTVITGISLDGTITGAKVTTHSETPGLGANAADTDWINQFAGLTADGKIATYNQIEVISHATITSDAVVLAVNNASQAFLAVK